MKKKHDFLKKINEKSKIAFYGNDESVEKVDVIPTGILPLDISLGIGGIPRGRVTDISGMPSVGKSTFCFLIIAQAQKQGIDCALIDAEYSYRPEYVEQFGVDPSKLIIIQPDCFEEGAEALEELVRSKIGLVVIDSLSSLVPRAEAEAEHGKSPMAIQARLVSQMLRKLISPIAKNNTAVVFINQLRINLMAINPYDKYTVTGGMALRFYSSIRLQIKRSKALMKGSEAIGYLLIFKITKNKLARLSDDCIIDYLFDGGFQKDGNIVDIAIKKGVLRREGNTIFHGEEKLEVGKEKTEQFLRDNPKIREKVISELLPQTEQ